MHNCKRILADMEHYSPNPVLIHFNKTKVVGLKGLGLIKKKFTPIKYIAQANEEVLEKRCSNDPDYRKKYISLF